MIKQNLGPLLVGLALGYATATATIISTVNRHDTEISNQKEVNQQIRSEFSEERRRTDDRIFQVAALVRDMIAQNQQFIEVLQVQNKLLDRQYKP